MSNGLNHSRNIAIMTNKKRGHRKTAPTRFHPQEYHATKTGLVPGHYTPTSKPKGTDHNPPTMGTDMGDISTDHNHAANSTMTGAATFPEGTYCTPYPATVVALHYPLAYGSLYHHLSHDTPHRHSHNPS